jgi:hypothetical protein
MLLEEYITRQKQMAGHSEGSQGLKRATTEEEEFAFESKWNFNSKAVCSSSYCDPLLFPATVFDNVR